MPKRLLQRCGVDCIGEFRLAAEQRFQDGLALAARGRRTAAVYLWGYAAEMTLKAGFFSLIGFAPSQAITRVDLRGARNRAMGMGIGWRGNNFHDLQAWSQLLVMMRSTAQHMAYSVPGMDKRVLHCGQLLQVLWSETLRYHKNMAYDYEVAQVREAAEWLLANSSVL